MIKFRRIESTFEILINLERDTWASVSNGTKNILLQILVAGKDHHKQLLVVDIKECEVLYVGAGGNNESVRVFRDFPACEKPDAPASACIIDTAEFPNMLAVLA